ncbi:MAG: hypothetical protein WBD20_13400, partial [Pirellulaceae bacterium]
MSRFWCCLFVVIYWCVAPAVAQDRGILDDALDFSEPPVLPEVAAASESEIRGAIHRGVQFL